MSFRKNPSQQLSLFDTTFGLTEREKKALDRSWAKVFFEDVFPYIDEESFQFCIQLIPHPDRTPRSK